MGTGRIFHSMEERERETGLPHPFRQPLIIFGMQRPAAFTGTSMPVDDTSSPKKDSPKNQTEGEY